jgi:putative membrane protein insertion efficiency factor
MEQIILKLLKFYQLFISSHLGQHCRYYPSCSEYTYLAIKKYGLIRGVSKGTWRILKCNPFHRGGIDLP